MKINIYQNYHSKDLKKFLDPAFIPHDNTVNENPVYREYWLFLTKIYEKNIHKNAAYTGLLSWKFNEKTKITGDTFINFIINNPGYDVYFVNPLPFVINSYAFRNVWLQGDFYHPGLLDLTQGIFNKINYNLDLKSTINDENTTLFCNYWVGSEKFWNKYIEFTKPVYKYLTHGITAEEKSLISKTADKIINIDYTPFIFERLFSTILAADKEIKPLHFRYSEEDFELLPDEERAAIMLIKSIADGHEAGDKELAIESIRTLIQKILRNRQDNLEIYGDISFQLSQRISGLLNKYPLIRKSILYCMRKR